LYATVSPSTGLFQVALPLAIVKVSAASPCGVTPRIATFEGMPSAPDLPAESSSKTWPRRLIDSRPMRVPSGAVQIQDSPCGPAVDWMT
jgi:hypothetical protein